MNHGDSSNRFDSWEAAYLRFQTPEQEITKFTRRLLRLGVAAWPKEAQIAELFCGRGNGLHALQHIGFQNLEGVDFSPNLLELYQGPAKCHVSDCRRLPFGGASKDLVIVQGGLHHLLNLPDDLDQTFAEIRRVLKPEGWAVFVEPWLTVFLRLVHIVVKNPAARRLSSKLDALATMIEHEGVTYMKWLNHPEVIRALAQEHFLPLQEKFAWGKWTFVGKPRP